MTTTKSRKPSKPAKRPRPPLVVEYHYDDGDVGAHPAGEDEAILFHNFSNNTAHKPSHILIRIASTDGQELSSHLHETAVNFRKAVYLRKIKEAEEMLNKLENAI